MNALAMRESQHPAETLAVPNPRASGLLAAALLALVGLFLLRGVGAEPAPPDTAASATEPQSLMPEHLRLAILEAERQSAAAFAPDPTVPDAIKDRWGVEVIRMDYTADGYWLGLRFRVTDADKALPLFDSRIKPYVQSEKSGVKLGVPSGAKVGALRTTNRQGNIKNGKVYNIMFSNPGTQVKPGDRVAVVIGDFKVDQLTVK
ncbi:hypothetical protein G3480_01235 [Thiorhodococcus mannitoliphagus]|uniref:Uncharacterized protein n=1 Tax=Thiorhodococcus mannitoliphagus TaxID=329406 RepID=A0A6P1DPV7_9GAMM|nr:hypothetical protein [Thiorhodococcus mannitoliphagus]NEX18951.1 hypothetical protein [Thiorhodococcus mannitoliphagus]